MATVKKENKAENASTKENVSVNVEIKKSIPDISVKSLTELMELKEATKFLIDYYENLAKANTGNYAFDSDVIYYDSKKLVEKYSKAYDKVVAEIENKVNSELF